MSLRARAFPLLAMALALAHSAAGCGGSSPFPRAVAPEAPSPLAKCKVAASQQSPLVTEWPASEKANLEVLLRQGGVVVSYSGCEMRLLTQCRVPGAYSWQRTTPATDVLEIRNEDDLYAKLPLGAVSLEGELRASGRLAVQTTVSGLLNLRGVTPEQVSNQGACAGATHLLGSLSVGAFSLKSGGALSARGGVDATIGGGRAGTSSQEALVREAGRVESCRESTEETPHADCRSPIQVFLWPLPWAQPEQGPPGYVKVNLHAADGGTIWDVMADGRVMCQTPCSRWMPPSVALMMKETDAPFYRKAEAVDVPDLRPYAAAHVGGPLDVRATTKSFMAFSGGITMTALGGMGVMTGLVLTIIGYAGHRDELGTAGVVTMVASPALMVPGIVIMVNSAANAEVTPTAPVTVGVAPAKGRAVVIGPGMVQGRF